MSLNLEAQRLELKELVAGAAAKERRNLSLSLIFTLLVFAAGTGWIAYATNKVMKLKGQEAELNTAITKLKVDVAEQEGLFRKLSSEIANVKPTLDKCAEGNSSTAQETRVAVAALSSAQQTVQIALNNPIKAPTQQTQAPTPTPVTTTVPDVTRMRFSDAEQKLRAAGLTITRVDQSGNAAPATVLYQDPLPNQRVIGNSQVTLYVVPVPASPAPIALPDLKGLTVEEATRRLLQAGLVVKKVDQPGRGVPGTVLYQDPFAGRRVSAGSQVSIYVIPKALYVQQSAP